MPRQCVQFELSRRKKLTVARPLLAAAQEIDAKAALRRRSASTVGPLPRTSMPSCKLWRALRTRFSGCCRKPASSTSCVPRSKEAAARGCSSDAPRGTADKPTRSSNVINSA